MLLLSRCKTFLPVPPKITTKPEDTNSLDAEVITLACRAIGDPRPDIKWKIETFDVIKKIHQL